MPIAAVPNYLGQDFKDASPGMRFGMYLKLWGVNRRTQELLWQTHDLKYEVRGQDRQERELKEENKTAALRDATNLSTNDKKALAALLARQKTAFGTVGPEDTCLSLEALATAPFTTGLGNEHPLENGFAFLNPYGLPYLPGSGVKGVLRQAARELASGDWGDSCGWTTEKIHQIGRGKDAIDFSPLDALFGLESANGDTHHLRGTLTFWDVIPQIKGDSLMVEIMTPHQSHYYQQKNDRKAGDSTNPHDSGQPNPINFLTVPPGSGFAFHATCDLAHLERLAPDLAAHGRWKTLLTAAFEHAFQWLGFGAKTAVGYGAMQSETQRKRQQTEAEERKEQEKIAQQEAAIQRQVETAVAWLGARIKFNRANGSLSVEKDGKSAIAVAPKGKELLDGLPLDLRKKVESNQFVRGTAYVSEGVLVKIEGN